MDTAMLKYNLSTGNVPFKGAYWVVAEKLMAGCYPSADRGDVSLRMLNNLLDHGITHVIDLMEPDEIHRCGEFFKPYAPWLKSLADKMDIAVTFDRIAIKDGSVPTRDLMCQILDRIDHMINANKRIYLHCWCGCGRTGLVVGCYLARHALASDSKIMSQIDEMRTSAGADASPNPPTAAQIEMVHSWVAGE
jgi:hypothetical protein